MTIERDARLAMHCYEVARQDEIVRRAMEERGMAERPWIVRVQWKGEDINPHWGPIMAESGDLRAIDCVSCGYTHLLPLPSQSDLDAFYDEFYTGQGCKYEQEAGQQWYWRRVYEERLREFERLEYEWRNRGGIFRLDGWANRPRLLDYGAGNGWFASHAERWARKHDSYWKIRGYEPNANAHPALWGVWQTGLGKPMNPLPRPIILNDLNNVRQCFPDGFHAIHCSLVLEHVRDPLRELRQMYDLLRPGGVLCLVVPNEFNPLQVRLERFGYSPLHLTHVNYFTPASLQRLVERAGFEVIRRTATFPIEWFALHGLNYVQRRWAGRISHMLRMIFEWGILRLVPRFKRRLYERWAARGIGREMEVWCRRPNVLNIGPWYDAVRLEVSA